MMTHPNARSSTATVRHLLSHSSGLANPIPLRWVHLATEPGPDRDELVKRLVEKHRRLRFDPGSTAAYSNLGYLVLGEIIEKVSGDTFENYIRRRILGPLAMDYTSFTADPVDQWATPHQLRRSALGAFLPVLVPRKIVGPTVGRFRTLRPFYVDGAAYGGLVGPASDAARFLQAHVGDGAHNDARILSAEAAQSMRHISASGKKLQVGLGWFRRGRHPDTAFVEHLGGGAGFWNCMRIYPDLDIGVVMMGNATTYDHDSIARAVIDHIG
jgi:CubicO group peptidase (beta-lactamase class C family)